MTNKQILHKAIEKAVEGGWKNVWSDYMITNALVSDKKAQMAIFFSHSFAKAFWGEKIAAWRALEAPLAWKYHLQQMVLEPEPLKYLSKFLGVRNDRH